jgi:hypothetical protein
LFIVFGRPDCRGTETTTQIDGNEDALLAPALRAELYRGMRRSHRSSPTRIDGSVNSLETGSGSPLGSARSSRATNGPSVEVEGQNDELIAKAAGSSREKVAVVTSVPIAQASRSKLLSINDICQHLPHISLFADYSGVTP